MRRIRPVLPTLLLPLLVLTSAAAPLHAQWTDRAPVPLSPTPSEPRGTAKSPTAARLIGIFPGAGHFYAGEPGRGLAFFGGTAGVLVVGALLIAGDCVAETLNNVDKCDSPVLENVATAAFLGVWGWSIYDAGLAARRTNARRGYRASAFVAPLAGNSRTPGPGRQFGIGVSIVPR